MGTIKRAHGRGCLDYTNEDGSLAWAASYMLNAYLDMYIATDEKVYLNKFVAQASDIMNKTDKSRNIRDYKGRYRVGWSATNNSKNSEPMLHMVHTGMIVYPLLRFCDYVQENNKGMYGEQCMKYVNISINALLEFSAQWYEPFFGGEGYYDWEGDEPIMASYRIPNAMNGQLALGRSLAILFRITREDEFNVKTERLANYFTSRIVAKRNGIMEWPYRHDFDSVSAMEDISHGAIDVTFALEAFKNNVVFSKEDITKFSNILIYSKGDDQYSKFVNGTGSDEYYDDFKCGNKLVRNYSDAVGRWLDLSSINQAIYPIVSEYLLSRVQLAPPDPQIILGIAKLVRYIYVAE